MEYKKTSLIQKFVILFQVIKIIFSNNICGIFIYTAIPTEGDSIEIGKMRAVFEKVA